MPLPTVPKLSLCESGDRLPSHRQSDQPMEKTTDYISAAVVGVAILMMAAVLMSPLCCAAAPGPAAMGLPGCETRCGNVSVPYPFGMGPDRCYRSRGFKLTCVDHGSSKIPRLLLGDGSVSTYEVVDITLEYNTMRVIGHGLRAINVSGGSGLWSVGDTWAVGVDAVLPYKLNPWLNEFILTGCNVQATLVGNGSLVSGCASFCAPDPDGDGNGYYTPDSHIGCCQSSIQAASASYGVELKRLDASVPKASDIDLPVNVLIAESGWFKFGENMEDLRGFSRKADQLRVPVILGWGLAHGASATDPNSLKCSYDVARSICKSANSYCRKEWQMALEVGGYSCHCKDGYEGNPYLTGGCQDIKECDQKEKYLCFGDCEELQGSFRCSCPQGTQGDYFMLGGCVKSTDTTTGNYGLIIGFSVASGPCILLLAFVALLITRDVEQRRATALREMFFSQNRGQLLKQLVSHRTDIAERMLISLGELEKATNNFDQARRLGGGGHGTVYKGILSDLHVVAIKKSNIVVKREIDEFINEVAILSQINHRNIVKLHGCCLEAEVPLLTYEFISNGTLNDHLHTEERPSLPWKDRLRITGEIGKALAYLHSAISVPVIHRDIKPANILLDDALTAKVSDFGASRYIPVENTGTTTAVQGTIRSSEGDGLIMQFVALVAEDNLIKILDPQVVEEGGSEVNEVATLAALCVKLKPEDRPTMRQVEMTLEALQAPKERVQGDLIEGTNEMKYVSMGHPSTTQRAKQSEATRCFSLEEEFLLSARHPR
uniref:Protein kinase domain-containing protein n=2 Tax=Hordeum vulgare subsp. vulgare TaxID=112509 RepID=A0A8I6XSZ1_HORVV